MNGRPQLVADFSLAVRQARRQGTEPPARWVKCTAWGRTAELMTDIMRKGDKVFLIGRVEPPELFTRRDGQQGLAEKFTVEAFEKLGESSQQQAAAAAPAAAPPAPVQRPVYAAPAAAPAAAPPQQPPLQPPPVWNSQAPAGGDDDPPF